MKILYNEIYQIGPDVRKVRVETDLLPSVKYDGH